MQQTGQDGRSSKQQCRVVRSKLAASKTGDRGERGGMQKNQDGPSKVGKTSTSRDLGNRVCSNGKVRLAINVFM